MFAITGISYCYGPYVWDLPPAPKFICRNLTPRAVVLGVGALERSLGLEGGQPCELAQYLTRDPTELPCPFCHVRTQREADRL